MKALLPPGWPRPKGYANGISAKGRLIATAGVVGWNAQEQFETDVKRLKAAVAWVTLRSDRPSVRVAAYVLATCMFET